jgi:hypothetical protein
MSVINSIGDFIGSGKLEDVVTDVKSLANTLGIKKTTSTTSQQVNAALNDFNTGYAIGTVKRYWPVLALAGVGLFVFWYVRKRG